ncbi:MAG: hypothetical protein IMF14_08760 [Proteobacteria bacterium]|nr:hypothetical protein [Pseudomonadota bacterium]
MKHLLLLNIILAALSIPAHAATVRAITTDVINTYGSFSATAGGSTALSDNKIQSMISSNPDAAVFGNNSAGAYSAIDLGFGDKTVVTGAGVDLVVFSLWSGYDYSFGLNAYNKDGSLLSAYKYDVTDASIYSRCDTGDCPTVVTTSINLFDNDIDPLELADDIELSYIRLFIGGDLYNGKTGGMAAYSNLTLAGAFNVKTTVVPLPLPIILFGSGLGLLGWIGRRKRT